MLTLRAHEKGEVVLECLAALSVAAALLLAIRAFVLARSIAQQLKQSELQIRELALTRRA